MIREVLVILVITTILVGCGGDNGGDNGVIKYPTSKLLSTEIGTLYQQESITEFTETNGVTETYDSTYRIRNSNKAEGEGIIRNIRLSAVGLSTHDYTYTLDPYGYIEGIYYNTTDDVCTPVTPSSLKLPDYVEVGDKGDLGEYSCSRGGNISVTWETRGDNGLLVFTLYLKSTSVFGEIKEDYWINTGGLLVKNEQVWDKRGIRGGVYKTYPR